MGAKKSGVEEDRDGNVRLEKLRGTSSSHSNDSNKKPMSVKSLSDHLSRDTSRGTSRGTSDFMSDASPIDEESSGGWSDDDSATIKSEYTDITHGTLGSAVVVDARAMTTSQDAAKKLRRMVAAKAARSQEDIVPGLPPDLPPMGKANASAKAKPQKASGGGEILFMPPRSPEESDDSNSDNDDDTTRKAGKSAKKKKKKKSKKSKDTSDSDIDVSGMFDSTSEPPKKEKKKDKKKKKEKKKVDTVEEDIVFDFNGNTAAEQDGATERPKKKKKKKKRKGDGGSGDESP